MEIAQYSNDTGFYLLHVCASGKVADTWHESIEEAMYQAEFEFVLQRNEWVDV